MFRNINVFDLYGTNDYLIKQKKYLVYFLFIVFFVCFLDIVANRINFLYLKDIFNKNKSFKLFDKNKYLININNNSDSDKDEYDTDNIIDDDCELLKKNKIKKDKFKSKDDEVGKRKNFSMELED